MFRTVWERDYDNAPGPRQTRKQVSSSLDLLQRMELQRTLQGHDGCVNSCSFDPTGTLLLSGSDDLKICIWDWEAGEAIIYPCVQHKMCRGACSVASRGSRAAKVLCSDHGLLFTVVIVGTIPSMMLKVSMGCHGY